MKLIYIMLWFKFIFGLKFFKPVWFLFSFVSDYGNEIRQRKIKIKLVWKNLNQKKFEPQHKLYNNQYCDQY